MEVVFALDALWGDDVTAVVAELQKLFLALPEEGRVILLKKVHEAVSSMADDFLSSLNTGAWGAFLGIAFHRLSIVCSIRFEDEEAVAMEKFLDVWKPRRILSRVKELLSCRIHSQVQLLEEEFEDVIESPELNGRAALRLLAKVESFKWCPSGEEIALKCKSSMDATVKARLERLEKQLALLQLPEHLGEWQRLLLQVESLSTLPYRESCERVVAAAVSRVMKMLDRIEDFFAGDVATLNPRVAKIRIEELSQCFLLHPLVSVRAVETNQRIRTRCAEHARAMTVAVEQAFRSLLAAPFAANVSVLVSQLEHGVRRLKYLAFAPELFIASSFEELQDDWIKFKLQLYMKVAKAMTHQDGRESKIRMNAFLSELFVLDYCIPGQSFWSLAMSDSESFSWEDSMAASVVPTPPPAPPLDVQKAFCLDEQVSHVLSCLGYLPLVCEPGADVSRLMDKILNSARDSKVFLIVNSAEPICRVSSAVSRVEFHFEFADDFEESVKHEKSKVLGERSINVGQVFFSNLVLDFVDSVICLDPTVTPLQKEQLEKRFGAIFPDAHGKHVKSYPQSVKHKSVSLEMRSIKAQQKGVFRTVILQD